MQDWTINFICKIFQNQKLFSNEFFFPTFNWSQILIRWLNAIYQFAKNSKNLISRKKCYSQLHTIGHNLIRWYKINLLILEKNRKFPRFFLFLKITATLTYKVKDFVNCLPRTMKIRWPDIHWKEKKLLITHSTGIRKVYVSVVDQDTPGDVPLLSKSCVKIK